MSREELREYLATTYPPRICEQCGCTYHRRAGQHVRQAAWLRRRYCGERCRRDAFADIARRRRINDDDVLCGRCADCGKTMVRQRPYRDDESRWRRAGYVQQGSGALCRTDYMRARREGRPVPLREPGLSDAELARLRRMVGAA